MGTPGSNAHLPFREFRGLLVWHDLRLENYTRNEWRRCKTTLETSGEDVKITLETSGDDVKTTPQMSGEDVKTTPEMSGCENYTRNDWRRCKTTLETSVEDTFK